MQLKWTDLAGTDLEKIEAHIAQENSPSVAIDVVINIIDSSHSILSEQLLIRTSQSITNCIEILRVLHDAQQWPSAD